MIASLRHLLRYRALIQSLVARELKARYRGSVLGFFWSFVNPLLLLLVYTFVFTVVLPARAGPEYEPYALFMFCGILPWTWFSSSLLEASNVLIGGGNLIRKVLFPAEVLPIVTVLAGLVHFCLGLPILAAFFAYYRVPVVFLDLLWLPVVMLVQLTLTLGLALLLSALAVHFRDIRDILSNVLTLWFFATPIIYPLSQAPESVRSILRLNPFTHLAVAYQEVLFLPGPFRQWPRLLMLGVAALGVLAFGYFVFDRLRDTLPEEV
ncbi:MAG TPA: ABC transporter permease [Vicinamibacterales bacterium]|nr:ABC transporter permease [Vicinamibacterales bacterium]